MPNGVLEFPNNQILNPSFTDGLRYWNHSGDVTVRDWPTAPPVNLGQCAALGPGDELGQLLGFMPTQHDMWFGVQIDDPSQLDLTVTVTYTDRDMNLRETSERKIQSDLQSFSGFHRLEVELDEDTSICYFNVVNNAPEAEVYLGVFYLQVRFDFNYVDPRMLWLAFSLQFFAEEPRRFRAPPPMNAMSPENRMLAAQIFALERKLARLTKRLGLQEEGTGKPASGKKKKNKKNKKNKKKKGRK